MSYFFIIFITIFITMNTNLKDFFYLSQTDITFVTLPPFNVDGDIFMLHAICFLSSNKTLTDQNGM